MSNGASMGEASTEGKAGGPLVMGKNLFSFQLRTTHKNKASGSWECETKCETICGVWYGAIWTEFLRLLEMNHQPNIVTIPVLHFQPFLEVIPTNHLFVRHQSHLGDHQSHLKGSASHFRRAILILIKGYSMVHTSNGVLQQAMHR